MQKRSARFMSRVLVLLMMLQLISAGPMLATEASADEDIVAAEESIEAVPEETVEEEIIVEPVEEPVETVVSAPAALPDGERISLHSGSALIPYNADEATVKARLCAALIDNYDPEKDYSSLEWEYECSGKNGLLTNTAWGSIGGFTSSKKVGFITNTYSHPALSVNTDGSYQVRIKGDAGSAVTLSKARKLGSSVELLNNSIKLCYAEDGSVDYDAVRALIMAGIATEPALGVEDVTIEYYATASSGSAAGIGRAWMPLEGGKSGLLSYPAMGVGEQEIKISYAGSDEYSGFSESYSFNVASGREASVLEFAAEPSFKLVYNEDLSIDYAAAYQAVYELLETKTPESISLEDLSIEYYATASTGSVGGMGKAWVPLEGGKGDVLSYPGIEEGTWDIRVSYPGSREYDPVSVTASVTVLGRPSVELELKEDPYELSLVFADAESYDYEATARAIFEAVVASSTPELGFEDVAVEYDASLTSVKYYRPISAGQGIYKAFGEGEWSIRISWPGSREYKGGEVVVNVTVSDSRIKSEIVYVEGAAISYNMDAAVMEQAIFDNMIDWEASTLPEKSTLSLEDFTIEYYALRQLEGGINGSDYKWVPIEGEDDMIGHFPKMGAAESQRIRISYRGSAEYRPLENVEGSLTVNKANVKVRVHSATIHAGEAVPAGFVTTDPADEFDIYTVYAGITSNVTTSVYLELPARYTNSAFLKVVDPIVAKFNNGKSLSDILNEGITIGELRKLLSSSGILELLDKIGVDTGTFGQIIKILDKLPSAADNVRVAFGTPKHAGVYTVAAVTDSPNYNTGVGVGALSVLKNVKGVKLTWNEQIGSKITVEQAQSIDWGVTLSVNGEPVSKEDANVHFLYSGVTSKLKPYSSTTVPPTEPGRYVVTVVTLGGDYLAAPITRSFRIVK